MQKKSRRLIFSVDTTTTGYVCNRCAAEFDKYSDKTHPISIGGGYGSSYPGDMHTLTFDVCETCLEEWVKSFKIQPEESGNLPWSGKSAFNVHRERFERFYDTDDSDPDYKSFGAFIRHYKGGCYEYMGVFQSEDKNDGNLYGLYSAAVSGNVFARRLDDMTELVSGSGVRFQSITVPEYHAWLASEVGKVYKVVDGSLAEEVKHG